MEIKKAASWPLFVTVAESYGIPRPAPRPLPTGGAKVSVALMPPETPGMPSGMVPPAKEADAPEKSIMVSAGESFGITKPIYLYLLLLPNTLMITKLTHSSKR